MALNHFSQHRIKLVNQNCFLFSFPHAFHIPGMPGQHLCLSRVLHSRRRVESPHLLLFTFTRHPLPARCGTKNKEANLCCRFPPKSIVFCGRTETTAHFSASSLEKIAHFLFQHSTCLLQALERTQENS